MLDNVGLRYPHRASGAKAPRTLRPLSLLRFAVSATGGAHLCSIQYYLRFWLSSCRTSLAVSALRIMRHCPNCGLQKRAPHAVRHLFVAVIVSIISYASRVSTDILTNIMQASLRCCSRFFFSLFPSFFTSPRHSRSRTFILTYYPKVYLKSKNAGYFHFSAAPQQKSSGQQSASRCLPYYNSTPECSAPLHLNYSSLSSGISSSKASIQLSLCHLSFSPFSLAATFCRCAWSFIMVPIGFSARSSIMW